MSITLKAPTRGISEASSPDHAQCGRLACLSVLEAFGYSGAFSAPDNATAAQLAAAVNAVSGYHAVALYDPVATDIENAVAAGHYPIVGVNCTPNAEPTSTVTGLRHWVAAYSDVGNLYNCWLPSYEVADLIACHNSLMGTVVISGPAPLPPTIGGLPVTLNGLTASTVVKIQSGRGSIAFTTPFTHVPVVVVGNGDVNAVTGSVGLVAVAETGFQVVAHNAQGAVLGDGSLIRVNWIAA